ncbi:sarcosine oxidase subunit gamma [Loktanella sp. D2R18]|uniref:sarcosine oxidase subunit gamma n=1 Tax=Rhodobacterales TaxID=204455 RepID=UPI000DEA3001|nr:MULTISPECIES: sarcosine oxidase subunit gamma family protein [Rhodobacterales]MDO6589790.1 sarcosine oxidase subunit gamma family protein [Yoonia sp. 1_MG-2023]RBW44409.1 sarcosine oxidase subunit gamma [Loktanella sp. D2R18]
MSNAVSALNGKIAAGEVTIREAGLRGMITLRGDLSDSKIKSVCTGLTGVNFPAVGQANCVGEKGLCWMSPDELLILVPYAEVNDALAQIAKTLKKKHHLAENVSDARALITVEGAFAREVIAKLAPVDLHPEAFQPGEFRRSHIGQVAAAFWMRDADTIEVICFRSVADYAFDLLAMSAKAGPVGYFD